MTVLPHLYDLAFEGPGVEFLRSVPGDMIVLSWLYPRSAYWVLDANCVRGALGRTSSLPDEEFDAAMTAARVRACRTGRFGAWTSVRILARNLIWRKFGGLQASRRSRPKCRRPTRPLATEPATYRKARGRAGIRWSFQPLQQLPRVPELLLVWRIQPGPGRED